MVTRVGLEKFWMTPFDWLTPKPPVWCKKSGTYVKFDQIYSTFCVKICRFSLRWQQWLVWHKVHFHCRSGLPVKPPIWHKSFDDISYTSCVIANFLLKFTIFGYYDNKGGSRKILNDSIWLADPQNPQFCENFIPYAINNYMSPSSQS